MVKVPHSMKRRVHLRALVAAASLMAMAAAMPAMAQGFTPAQESCNALAASPADNTLPEGSATVEFTLLDATAAIAACTEALTDVPDDPRTMFQLGRSYDRAEDYANAIKHYEAAIESDYAAAMRAIGLLHANGDGVPQDNVAAADWQQKAIDAGSLASLVDLGWYYYSGIGVTQDIDQAVSLFQQAADTGLPYALVALAWVNESGAGLPMDEAKAFSLYKQAAEAGDIGGMYNLGLVYRDAKFGYASDYDVALDWFSRAGDGGNAEAAFAASQLYAQGLGVPANEGLAEEWLEKAAAMALPETSYAIGGYFEFGSGGAIIDYAQSAKWYRMGADAGHVDSVWALARLYYEEPSLEGASESAALFEQAFALGGGYYGYFTGSTYEAHGDYATALDWYERSAETGDVASMLRAGTLLETGNVVARDGARAAALFEQAATDNVPETLLSIGYAYYYGDETGDAYVPNLPKALEWMQRAADAGSDEAAGVALDIEAEIAATADASDDITTQPDDTSEDDVTPTTGSKDKDKDRDDGDIEPTTPTGDADDKGTDKG